MLSGADTTAFVKGGAGTGKTVLAVFLMKLLAAPLEELLDTGQGTDAHNSAAPSEERKLVSKLKTIYPSPKIALYIICRVYSAADNTHYQTSKTESPQISFANIFLCFRNKHIQVVVYNICLQLLHKGTKAVIICFKGCRIFTI